MAVEFDLTKEFDSDVNVDYVDIKPALEMQTVIVVRCIAGYDKSGRKVLDFEYEAENGASIWERRFIKRERDAEADGTKHDDDGTVKFLKRMKAALRLENINDIFKVSRVAIRAGIKELTDENGQVKYNSSDKPYYGLYGIEALPLDAGAGKGAGAKGAEDYFSDDE